jgi:MFS family permease
LRGSPDPGPEFSSFLRSRQFILLIVAAAMSGVISNGINEYIPLFIERHTSLGAYVAALGFTIVIVISGLGKILFGWVFDRLPRAAWRCAGRCAALQRCSPSRWPASPRS